MSRRAKKKVKVILFDLLIDNEEEILEFTNNLGCDLELIVEGYQDMIAKGGTPADFGYFSPTIDIPSNAAAV